MHRILDFMNMHKRSVYQKKCKVHGSDTTFKACFKVKTDNEELSVEPNRGCIQYKKSIKMTIIFKPVLNKEVVYRKAVEMKTEVIKMKKVQELLDLYYQQKEKKTKKMSTKGSIKGSSKTKTAKHDGNKSKKLSTASEIKGNKKPKGSVISTKTKKTKLSNAAKSVKRKDSGPLPDVVIDQDQVVVTEEDLREAEIWLLKYMEPRRSDSSLLISLDTSLGSGERRQERLMCRVVCTSVAPSLALCSPACLQFGPTALGTTSRLSVCVTNVSFLDVPVLLSTLDPVGPLSCPFALETPMSVNGEGVELPPEHTLNIPILFQPVGAAKKSERFQVLGKNTVVHLQAKGQGVIPSFIVSPDQEVFTFSNEVKKKAEVVIAIENTCEATLRFSFRTDFVKEGLSLPAPTSQSPPHSPGDGSKKPVKNVPNKKTKAKQEITAVSPELSSWLEKDFVDLPSFKVVDPWFRIVDCDKYVEVPVGSTNKIVVRFTPQENIESRPDPAGTKSARKKSTLLKTKPGKTKNNKDSENKRPPNETETSGRRNLPNSPAKPATPDEKQLHVVNEVAKEKDKTLPKSRVIAAKYSVLLGDVKVVREWLFLGMMK